MVIVASLRHASMLAMPRFLCDAMLGSLARWLRLFGYDTEFSTAPDAELVERARLERRWLLTRDRELASVGPRSLLIRSENLEEQLVEVLRRLGLTPRASLESARCPRCNGALTDMDRERAMELVPPFVGRNADRFRRCTGCGAVYWPGTHTGRIRERLGRVVEAASRAPVAVGRR